jgi:hypothetical protein
MATVTLETIHKDLEFLKKEVSEIKEHIVDVDVVLTEDDIESLKEAEKDFSDGKTKRLA